MLEADPHFVFTLDGQTATLDDYLEVRPENEERVRRLVSEGRLAIGPWQILVDEFLVSGESIIRNLEQGLSRARDFGGAMAVGYLPDMFGHVAQMPQILRLAGLEHAVVWRGVPRAVDWHAFVWEAPDGSAVRAEYLPAGYGNAAYLFSEPERLEEGLDALAEASVPFFGDDPLLAMYGTDHTEPDPGAFGLVERLNATQDAYRLHLTTVAGYLAETSAEDTRALAHWRGEMRSGARANLLMGVTSARIELKAACTRAERLLERYAEPLQALYGGEWPERLLELAWRRVIENSAHDSICGCSVDPVADQVLVRFAEAEQIARGLTARAAAEVGRLAPVGSCVVLNPSPHERVDLVELELPIPDEWEEVALRLPDGTLLETQETGRSETFLYAADLPGRDVPRMFRRLHGRELFGRFLNGFSIDEEEGRPCLILEVGDEQDPLWLDVQGIKREVQAAAEVQAAVLWGVRIIASPRRTLASSVPAPALGWTSVRAVSGRGRSAGVVQVSEGRLVNGLVEVELGATGLVTLGGGGVVLEGVGKLVDGGDVGDSYNYAPPAVDLLVEEPVALAVEVVAAGPLRGELRIGRRYDWPLGAEPDGSTRTAETRPVTVETSLELRAGEPFLRVAVSFENPSSDHRLRYHVPLPAPADETAAEGQFGVVARGLEMEGGYGEYPLPTFPARGFVAAGNVAVLLQHVLEYELVEGRELALTLLRATGLLSRNANPYREDPAGPEIEIPGAQGRDRRAVSFALYPHPGDWSESGVLAEMESYQHPFVTAPGRGKSAPLCARHGLTITGDGVALSSLRRRGEELEARLVCQQNEARSVLLSGEIGSAFRVDLAGRRQEELRVVDGSIELELRPWEIRTLRLSA